MYLDHFKITNLSFSINEKFKWKKKKPVMINHKIAIGRKYSKKNKTLNIYLKVSFNEGNVPFFVNVETEGIFSFKEFPDNKTLNQLSSINCPAIIFPYIRETIADLTRRAGYPPLHMPSINFVEMAKSKKKTVKKTKKT